jgi:hypothetical protein
MSFKIRKIDVQFNLGVNQATGQQKTFSEGGTQLYVSRLRASAQIVQAGGLSMGNATLTIWGMTLSQMNQLSTLGINPLIIGPNFLTILAGDADGMSVAFQGSITNAWMDGNGQPEVGFRVEAHAGLFAAIAASPPKGYPVGCKVQDVLSVLANEMGFTFENNGVNVTLPPGTYFHGSARNQAYAAAKAAGINIVIEKNVLAIWPKGAARNANTVITIQPGKGMKGYPTYTSKGIEVECEYNPAIQFGGTVQIKNATKPDGTSILPAADGKWNVYTLEHNLEAQVPNGSWFSVLRAAPPGSVVLTPGVQAPIPQ